MSIEEKWKINKDSTAIQIKHFQLNHEDITVKENQIRKDYWRYIQKM